MACNPLGDKSIKDAHYMPGLNNSDTIVTTNWPFTLGTEGDYIFDPSQIEFNNGSAEVLVMDQQDSNAGDFAAGTLNGVAWISNTLRLDNPLTCGASGSCSELDSGWAPHWVDLLGYWKLNETSGSTFLDSSGNNNDGTVGGDLVISRTLGKIGNSISLSGVNNTGGHVTLPFLTITNSQDFALQAWIRPTSKNDYRGIFHLTNNDNSVYLFPSTAGQTYMYWERLGSSQHFTTTMITDGNWYHVVAQRKAGMLEIYVNGVKDTHTVPDNRSFIFKGIGLTGYPTETFIGNMDEVAFWNTSLSDVEVLAIYQRQSADLNGKFAGVYVSRVMGSQGANHPWTHFSWTTSLPFMKELPDANCSPVFPATSCAHLNSENRTDYSGLYDDDLMNGITGLWHLDEASGNFVDKSGNGVDGTPVGNISYQEDGKMGKAIYLDGVGDYIDFGDISTYDYHTEFTVSGWFNLAEYTVTGGACSGMLPLFMNYDWGWVNYIDNNGNFTALRYTSSGFANSILSLAPISISQWYHYAMVKEAGSFSLYLNGVLQGSVATTDPTYYTGSDQPMIGRTTCGGTDYYFKGFLDEHAIWSRGLSATEVQQIYRRGANRIKYQFRTCTTGDCSDTGDSGWKGPNGTESTYFSELNNNSKNPANLQFSDYTSPITASKFFQYRAILESDDSTSPELKVSKLNPVFYDTSGPTLVGNTPLSLKTVTSLIATLGVGGCSAGVVYNVGVGSIASSATWYWWNGSSWVMSNGTVTEANLPTVISSNANSLKTIVGAQKLFIKAYLKSSGTSVCSLDQLDISGKRR